MTTQVKSPRFASTLFLMLSLLLSVSSAQAHHSFAMYDSDNQIKRTGIVTLFQWTNPHVYIEMEAEDANGDLVRWTIECANPGILSRIGWKHNIIKEGDEITIIVAPLRTGEPGALLKQVTLADGTKMGNGGPAGKPNIE